MPTDWGDGVTFHPAAEWRTVHGDWPKSTTPRPLDELTEFFVHHSGPQQQITDVVSWLHSEYVAYTTGQNQNHETYVDLGYNAVVTELGGIWEVRDIAVVGGATLGHNTTGYAACYLRTSPATDLAKIALQKLYAWASEQAGRELAELVHSDVFATDCPGDDLRDWVHRGGLHTLAPPAPTPKPPAPPILLEDDVPKHLLYKGDNYLLHGDGRLEDVTEISAVATELYGPAFPCDDAHWHAIGVLRGAMAASKPGGAAVKVAP